MLVHFRLGDRKQETAPPFRERAQEGWRALLCHGFNGILGAALALAGWIPALMAGSFLVMMLDAVDAIARPPIGLPPPRIGLRQLVASSSFIVLSVGGFLSW